MGLVPTGIDWLAWSADAFARAGRERRPVLLSISAAWCAACHEMDRTTYADPRVGEIVRDRFVPIRVDADHRPDINDRYNLGGWPTTAFLTPAAQVITGGTFVAADRMPEVLTHVAAEYARNPRLAGIGAPAYDGADDPGGSESSVAPPVNDDLLESIFSSYDADYGGFGVEPKFPHTAPLRLALALFEDSGLPRWRTIVERTLDAMADGPLWDERGGFCRYATTRDWQLPHRERLLETNALLLRVYAEAVRTLGRNVDRERCTRIAAFITGPLAAEGGGYYGSDADRILYMEANATATGALLAAAEVLEDAALARSALASFERVTLACYKPGAGLAHLFDGSARVRGLLSDHVAAIATLLEAFAVSDGEPYRMMAEELGHYLVRELYDARGGGFFDRIGADEDVGLLRQRRKPFLGNAEAAAVFARLSSLEPRRGFPDPADLAEHASRALEVAGRQLDGQGPNAAHYALAARHLIK